MTDAEQIAACQERPRLSYLDFFADADRRAQAGQQQQFCTVCQRWKWPDLLCPIAQAIGAAQWRQQQRIPKDPA